MESTQTSQYITLPASSSSKYYKDNTNSHYFTKLDQRLNLKDGNWEVAIADLYFPVTWSTIADGWMLVTETEPVEKTHSMKIKAGRPESVNELILRLNLMLKNKRVGHLVRTFYDSFRNQVLIDVKKGVSLKMSDDLCDILGYERESPLTKGVHQSVRPVDIEGGFHSIFIYSDLVKRRAVGDKQLSLLQMVSAEGKRHTMVHIPFVNRQYQRAAGIESETIEIRLTRDDGEDVPFTSGRVSLTLHLRKTK